MVSHKQLQLIGRKGLWVAAFAAAGGLYQQASAGDSGRKFYPDDPLLREPAPTPVTGIPTRSVDHIFDFLESSYVTKRLEGKLKRQEPRTALDVNTLGEVPDSAWYTNRHAFHRMSIAELQRGLGDSTPPEPSGTWRITAAKTNGITPGFVIEDGRKNQYVLKFDPPLYPELCSAADVIGSKFFYALGYSTPENYIIHFRPEQLEIADGVLYRHPSGKNVPLTKQVVYQLLRDQPKLPDGTYRALASRWLNGKVVGPFDYSGTRSDDPNDTVDHEDRRVLRGLGVFSSWLNHHDSTQINTMDVLVNEDGRQYIKHYLIDFGSILGSRGDRPKAPWIGNQYTVDHKESALRALSFGLHVPRWERSDYPKLKGVGLFDAWSFDPLHWKPEVPNAAFLRMDTADAFWAAKQVAAFTDEEIRAIVETGKYSDPRAADWIANSLIQRRDKIAQAWFSKVLPLDRFRVVDGKLAFDDLSIIYHAGKPRTYVTDWFTFDNQRRQLTGIANMRGTKVPAADASAEYLAARIGCDNNIESACPSPVWVYVRRSGSEFQVVGVDRESEYAWGGR